MSVRVEIREVESLPLLVASGTANARNISEVIYQLLDKVWTYIRAEDIDNAGLNVAVYPFEGCAEDFFGDKGARIEAGVLMNESTDGMGDVYPSATPSGRAAMATHIGPYEKIPETYDAIHTWCRENGHQMASIAWEIYGHWTENSTELHTDIYCLLK